MSYKIESSMDFTVPEKQILSDSEQIELASWEMYIKIIQELGRQHQKTLKLSNENLLKFCKLFDEDYSAIIDKLLNSIRLSNAPSKSNMFCTINNMGLIDVSGDLNAMFMAALEHLVAKEPLMQEILDSVEFSRFDHIIDSYVKFYTERTVINLSNDMPVAQKLADYRQSFIYDCLEAQYDKF